MNVAAGRPSASGASLLSLRRPLFLFTSAIRPIEASTDATLLERQQYGVETGRADYAMQAAESAGFTAKPVGGRFLRRWTNNQDDRNRPALAKAFAACRVFNAKLVIWRLDRLAVTRISCLALSRPESSSSRAACRTRTGSQSGSWLWSLRKSVRRSPKGPRPPSPPPKPEA